MTTDYSPVGSVKENFYIGSLPGIVDGRELRRYLQQFGDVDSLEIIKDASTGKCKGYAFLSIKLTLSETQFLNIRHFYDGRIIFIRQKLQGTDLKHHKEDFQQKRLYISTSSRRLSDYDLFVYFSKFGEVDLAYFVKNHVKSKDKVFFGYVNFKSDDSVKQVMAMPKHMIKKQEVKCDIYRPKKKSSDPFEGEKLKNTESYERGYPIQFKRLEHAYVLSKQKTSDTQTVLSNEEKKALRRAIYRLPVKPSYHAEHTESSSELPFNHSIGNIRFNYPRLGANRPARVQHGARQLQPIFSTANFERDL